MDLAAPGAKHAVVVDDRSDTWGHGVRSYDDEVAEFECVAVRLLETGPVRAILRVESRYGSSTLREDYVLSAGAAYVDVRVALDWREPLKLLKLRYPTSVETDTATFETPYGHLERPTGGEEEPGQSWVDVSGGGRGLTVINNAKYGYDVRGGDIGITAVRSPVWAWHDPRELEEAVTSTTSIRRGRPFSCASSRTPATGATPGPCGWRRSSTSRRSRSSRRITRGRSPSRRPTSRTAAARSSSRSSSAPRTARARSSSAPTSRPVDRRRRGSSCPSWA